MRCTAREDRTSAEIGIEFEDGGDPLGVARRRHQYRAGACARAPARRTSESARPRSLIGRRSFLAERRIPGTSTSTVGSRCGRLGGDAAGRLPAPRSQRRRDLTALPRVGRRGLDAVVALDDGTRTRPASLLERRRSCRRSCETRYEIDRGLGRCREPQPPARAAVSSRRLGHLARRRRADDADDAAALRQFLATDAIPACAYGLQHFRMWGASATTALHLGLPGVRVAPGSSASRAAAPFQPGPDRRPACGLDPHHPATAPSRCRVRGAARAAAGEVPRGRPRPPLADRLRTPLRAARWRAPVWQARDPDLPVLSTVPAGALAGGVPASGPQRRRDLPGWFESARRFADAVVALDDGSTDERVELLERAPLVQTVLRQPAPRVLRRLGRRRQPRPAARRRRGARAGLGHLPRRRRAHRRRRCRCACGVRRARRRAGVAYGFRVSAWSETSSTTTGRPLGLPAFALRPAALPRAAAALRAGPDQRSTRGASSARPSASSTSAAWTRSDARRASRSTRRRTPATNSRPTTPICCRRRMAPRRWNRARRAPGGRPERAGSRRPRSIPGPALGGRHLARRRGTDRAVGRAVVGQECPEPFEVIVAVSGTRPPASIVASGSPRSRSSTSPSRRCPAGRATPGSQRPGRVRLVPGLARRAAAGKPRRPPAGPRARLADGHRHDATAPPPARAGRPISSTTRACCPGGPPAGSPARPRTARTPRDLLAVGGFPEDMRAGEDTVVNVELSAGARDYRASDVTIVHHSRCRTR